MTESFAFREYESRAIPCPPPTLADRRLAERLASGGSLEPRLDVEWLLDGQMRVTAFSWIGVVRFSGVEIRVLPKLVGDALQVLRMIEYADGVRLIARLPTERALPADGTDLFDLVVLLLTEETKALVRDGLIRDYRSVDDSLDAMRGRLRIRDQYLRRYGQLHRLECQFDEFDGNVPDNQLISAALHAAERRIRDSDVRNTTRVMAGIMSAVCDVKTQNHSWYSKVIRYGRRNARYRPAHELSKLVLTGLALADAHDKSATTSTSFMVDMNAIFERFVTRLVVNSLTGTDLRVRPQKTEKAVILDEDSGQTYSSIRPDLTVEDQATGRTVPIDVKYKHYDLKKFASADIYQSFVYAYAVGIQSSSPARAGLIYPSSTPIAGPSLYIKPISGARPARIRGFGLDVSTVLDEIGGSAEGEVSARVLAMIRLLTDFTASIGPDVNKAATALNHSAY